MTKVVEKGSLGRVEPALAHRDLRVDVDRRNGRQTRCITTTLRKGLDRHGLDLRRVVAPSENEDRYA